MEPDGGVLFGGTCKQTEEYEWEKIVSGKRGKQIVPEMKNDGGK